MKIKEQDYIDAAKVLGCEVAAIKAVDNVESRGDGFNIDGTPKILFERHKFHQFTKGKFSVSNPNVSNSRVGGYIGGVAEHKRLAEAVSLNRNSALMSASWGRFQIMGFNYKLCGFSSLQSFINAMFKDEGEHLKAFVNFVKSVRLDDELRRKDWAGFAKGYNGSGYKKNQYDTKMRDAYLSFKK